MYACDWVWDAEELDRAIWGVREAKRGSPPSKPKEESTHWLSYTSRVLTLSDGSWVSVEDDPDGGFFAKVHVDTGGHTLLDATRGEIETLDKAKEWATDTTPVFLIWRTYDGWDRPRSQPCE